MWLLYAIRLPHHKVKEKHLKETDTPFTSHSYPGLTHVNRQYTGVVVLTKDKVESRVAGRLSAKGLMINLCGLLSPLAFFKVHWRDTDVTRCDKSVVL